MKSFTVIGLGLFGMRTAQQLASLGLDVLAIDCYEEKIEQVAGHVTRAAIADAKNKDALQKLGVQNCDCAIVAIGADLGTSVLVTMNLKALNVPKIICKAHDETHREILQKLGADQVIIPEHVVADRLAASLSSPNVLDFIELSDEYSVVECTAPDEWVGKTLKTLDIRREYGVNIIALRENGQVSISPSAEDEIKKGMTLVLLGSYDALRRIQKL